MRKNAGDKEEKEHGYFKHPYSKSYNQVPFLYGSLLLSQSIKQTRAVESYCYMQAKTWCQELGHTQRVWCQKEPGKGTTNLGRVFSKTRPLTNQRVFKQFNVSVWRKRNCDLHPSHWFRDENFISGFRGVGEIIWPCTCVFEDTPLSRRLCSLKLEHQAPWWPLLLLSVIFSHHLQWVSKLDYISTWQ